ncbi:MAG: hypothetical protein V7K67_34635 [Nostoc sp.]
MSGNPGAPGLGTGDWGLGTGDWGLGRVFLKLGWGLNPRTIFPVPSP